MNPKLTIIIATYNSGKTLNESLKSLLEQTYQCFEIILIDGLSNDNTVEIIKEYEIKFNNINVSYKWLSEKDTGIYDAWNKGLRLVNSNWVAFLGSDDTYLPNALYLYEQTISRNPSVNYVSSKVQLIDNYGKNLKIIGAPYNYNQMNRFMNIAHVGSFHKKTLFTEFGNFSKEYRIAGDYEFFIRNANSIRGVFIDSVTAKMSNGGVSNDLGKLAIKEVLKIQLKHKRRGVLKSYSEYLLSLLKYNIRLFLNRS